MNIQTLTEEQEKVHSRRRPDLHTIEPHELPNLNDLNNLSKQQDIQIKLDNLRKQTMKTPTPTVAQRVKSQAAIPVGITAGGALAAIASTIGMTLLNARRPGFANTYFP